MTTIAYANNPEADTPWSIQDCVVAAARLVDETLEVVEFTPNSGPLPDALVLGALSTISVFPDVPMARVVVAAGPPGPATRATLEVFNGQRPTQFRFGPTDFGTAVMDIAEWLDSSLQLGVSAQELRQIERIQLDVSDAIRDGFFQSVPDLAAQLRSVADTLEAQMKAPHPGRKVIGWCLRQLNTFPAGVLGNIAASYLYDLLPHFPK